MPGLWSGPPTDATPEEDGDLLIRATLRPCALLILMVFGMPPLAHAASPNSSGTTLAVPLVRQSPEHCGQAALEMVLRYYGAGAEAIHEADQAYDPALHGSLITDLAAAARRAGFDAEVATLTPDSLVALLDSGVPPVVLYQSGRAPVTAPHFGVVTGWNPARDAFTLHDGGPAPRNMSRTDLQKRWRTAGSQALLIRSIRP